MSADLAAAEQFLAAHARVLERRGSRGSLRDGPAGPVRDAVAAYRNADGGFGTGSSRRAGAGSRPPRADRADVLDDADASDDELARGACDWLAATEPDGGGTPFVLPGVEGWPHAPWWAPQDGLPASLTTTGQVLGAAAAARGRASLDRAGERVDVVEDRHEPEARTRTTCAASSRSSRRRRTASARGGGRDARADDPRARPSPRPGGPPDVHRALDYAAAPEAVARRAFDAAQIEADLDALEPEQRDDGGWTSPGWAWSPAAEADSRGMRDDRGAHDPARERPPLATTAIVPPRRARPAASSAAAATGTSGSAATVAATSRGSAAVLRLSRW